MSYYFSIVFEIHPKQGLNVAHQGNITKYNYIIFATDYYPILNFHVRSQEISKYPF